jgi:cobalt/nickel transport system permease protein
MHMADALLSPVVGAVGWAGACGLSLYSARKVQAAQDEKLVPLMGVSAAFVFAAQMVNFTIPGTGSSGHLGGGLLLAAMLGPHAALLAIASVLTVQALLFGDGGLLALGCNIINLGLFPCFVAYPLYRAILGKAPSRARLMAGSLASAVVALQLGAFAVVIETLLSGKAQLPLFAFALLMQPIHLAIGVVEGLATATVLLFVTKARPALLEGATAAASRAGSSAVLALGLTALLIGGGLSALASTQPDGLEWSLSRAAGTQALDAPRDGAHGFFAGLQKKTALLPDYGFGAPRPDGDVRAWPAADAGTSLSGIVGVALTLCGMLGLGLALRRKRPAT